MNFSCAEIYAGFDLRDRSYEKHLECNKNKVNRQCYQQITGIRPCLRSHLITLRLRTKYIASRQRNFLQNGG